MEIQKQKIFSQLLEHQNRVIERLFKPENKGIIAFHSMGSGKTFTALSAADRAIKEFKKPALFIVPASLVENVHKEILKHNLNQLVDWVKVYSYEKAANIVEILAQQEYSLIVFDEAHRLRNAQTNRVHLLSKLVANADKVLLLTGTAGYNHPSDITSLINVIDKTEHMPTTHTDFEKQYVDNRTWQLKHQGYLSGVLNRYVDKYDTPQDSADFPRVEREIIKVPMSKKQEKLYRYMERKLPIHLRKSVRDNLPITLKESSQLNMFNVGIRQASDSTYHHDITGDFNDSTKITLAVDNLIKMMHQVGPGFRAVVYSNFVDSGIKPYVECLNARGIKPLVFDGSLSKADKKKIIDEYNTKDSKPKILIISSSGAEGIDLKRTRLLQILEPHFNLSKIRQVEGRAARYQSHADLPEKDRVVRIEEYHSTLEKSFLQKMLGLNASTAIDDYLHKTAQKKQQIVDDMSGLIRNYSGMDEMPVLSTCGDKKEDKKKNGWLEYLY